ncbi:hypothetical protein [Rheinheimera pleomorphica]|uniref:hypothetical protein n=1 Tax=Rheinheimera pleomorphica TaxID=2703963 RepID=UPI00141F1B90|nr:hypothetical protein [Rheinheimera pleomorphica]
MANFYHFLFFGILLSAVLNFGSAEAQSLTQNCANEHAQTKPQIRGKHLLRSFNISCDISGHILVPARGYQWLNQLAGTYFIPARTLVNRDRTDLPADYFTEISAWALDGNERDILAINLLQHTFSGFYRPNYVTQVHLKTLRGVILTLYLMPDRGILCQNNCATLQVFSIKHPTEQQEMSNGQIGMLIVIGLLNWPVLALYLGMMLIPSLYPDGSYGSKTLDGMMKHNHRGALVIPMVIVMQWKVLIGAYTEQAIRCGYISLLRAGQAMVLTNLGLIAYLIANY